MNGSNNITAVYKENKSFANLKTQHVNMMHIKPGKPPSFLPSFVREEEIAAEMVYGKTVIFVCVHSTIALNLRE
jgi:hypothetical protein